MPAKNPGSLICAACKWRVRPPAEMMPMPRSTANCMAPGPAPRSSARRARPLLSRDGRSGALYSGALLLSGPPHGYTLHRLPAHRLVHILAPLLVKLHLHSNQMCTSLPAQILFRQMMVSGYGGSMTPYGTLVGGTLGQFEAWSEGPETNLWMLRLEVVLHALQVWHLQQKHRHVVGTEHCAQLSE